MKISIAAPVISEPGAPDLYPCVIPTEHTRAAIVDVAAYLCGADLTDPAYSRKLVPSDAQRLAFGDPVYEWVTLKLQIDAKRQGWFFSSCAYLVHCALELMGWEFDWLGRGTRQTPRTQPLSRLNTLADRGKPADGQGGTVAAWDLQRGDCLQIGATDRTAHVQIVCEYLPAQQLIRTANYGQPGGALLEQALSVRHLAPVGPRLYIGNRPLMRRLSLCTLGLSTALARIPEPVVDHWLATGRA